MEGFRTPLRSIQRVGRPTKQCRVGLKGRTQHRHPGLGLGEVNGREQLGVAWGVVFHNEEVKYNARGNRQRIPRKCPGLAAVACGPRPETKNKSFVHAYHAFFRSYTKIVLYLVHSLAVFTTAY